MQLLKRMVKKTLLHYGVEIRKLPAPVQLQIINPTPVVEAAPAATKHTDKKFFLVTSYGLSASNWFANALNMHPEITCTHSEENLLASDDLHTNSRLAEDVEARFQARINRPNVTLDDFFEGLTTRGRTPVFGGVHTHRLSDLQKITALAPSHISFKLMNLVRHPVSLVNSGMGHLADLLSYDIYMMLGLLGSIVTEKQFFFAWAKQHQVNIMDPKVQSFIGGCTNLLDLGRDYQTDFNPTMIKMEELTTQPDYYRDIVTQLVQGKIAITDEYIDRVFDVGVVNPHHSGKVKTPAEYYAQWEPWQKECFQFCLSKTTIASHYQKLGYDLSFI